MADRWVPTNRQVVELHFDQMNFDNLKQNVLVLTALETSGSGRTVFGEYATTSFYAKIATMCNKSIKEQPSQQTEQSRQTLGWLTHKAFDK